MSLWWSQSVPDMGSLDMNSARTLYFANTPAFICIFRVGRNISDAFRKAIIVFHEKLDAGKQSRNIIYLFADF